jgi:hypothetical protein
LLQTLRVTRHRKLTLFGTSHFVFEYVSQTSSQIFTNFPVADISQVTTCVSSQINERVNGEGSFAKGFAMSSDLSRPFLSCKKSQWHWGSTCGSAKDSSTKFPEGLLAEL